MTAIAAWRRALQPGSFRGVPFKVKGVQTQVGRRAVIHEYPQRDEAFPEDLGRKARQFSIEAILIGPEYHTARNALIEALEKRGPGLLVHPYYGQRTVTLSSPARISESPEEGGLARFSLDFIEAGENTQPSARPDTQASVEARADAANQAIGGDFARTFSLAGAADFVSAGALTVARDAMSALEGVRRAIVPDLSILSTYVGAASGVMGSLNALLRAPAAFASSLLGLFAGLTGLARNPLSALAAYRGLFGYGKKHRRVPSTTPARVQQAGNQVALAAIVRRAALVEASRASSRVVWPSHDLAVTTRDDLAARLDDEAAGLVVVEGVVTVVPVSEPVYQALMALRVAVVRDLTIRAATAPRVSSATLPKTLPALVAAYRLYGDARRDVDIISRNPRLVRHPGFVPGGVALEVLTR